MKWSSWPRSMAERYISIAVAFQAEPPMGAEAVPEVMAMMA